MRQSGWLERVLLQHRLSDGSTRSLTLVLALLALGYLITTQLAALQAVGLTLTCSWERSANSCTWLDPYFRGRTDALDPSPRCCVAEECLQRSQHRHAVVTSLRNDHYLPLLLEVACSLNATNPALPLLVMTVEGDLSPAVEAAATAVAQVVRVPELKFDNTMRDGRYALNWVKLRVWEWEAEWDALLVLDADTTVTGDVGHLFELPVDFAIVLDSDKRARRYGSLGSSQGGVMLVRPCAAVAAHMEALAAGSRLLQFRAGHAEQDFINWYFKYSRMTLPLRYNAIAHLLVDGSTLPDGSAPRIVHYTWHKPFRKEPDKPGHQLLCRGARRRH